MKSTALKKKDSIPIKKYASLFLFLFVVAVFSIFTHFNEEPFNVSDIRESGPTAESDNAKVAPEFTIFNLQGNRDGLSNYRGKVVLLNIWATWCAPCRVEMPMFETLYRRYRTEGLTVLAVCIDKNADDKVKAFVEKRQLSFPVLIDREGVVEKLYPSLTVPATFVIDKTGNIVTKVDGAKNWESEETFKAIEFLLHKL